MEQELVTAEGGRDEALGSLRALEVAGEAERKQEREQREALETKSFELQSEVLSLQTTLATALQDAKLKAKADQARERQQREQGEDLHGNKKRGGELQTQTDKASSSSRGTDSNMAMPPLQKPMKSSNNKTAVVVPVRQATGSVAATGSSSSALMGSGHSGKSVDYYSNDSDCVMVKDDVMEYIEIDNAQSDVENGGNVSENSSVVVQWNHILPGSSNNLHSPNSDVATDTSSPTNTTHTTGAVDTTLKKDISGRAVCKVESLQSITSCSSETSSTRESSSVVDRDRLQEDEDEDEDVAGGRRGRPRGHKQQQEQDCFLVQELKRELHQLRQELSNSHMAVDDMRRDSCAAMEARSRAERDYHDLQAFHERTKKLLNSPDSAMNIEYLKKCVYRLMVTKEISERSRLYPVISMLLKFTPEETREVTGTIQEEVAAAGSLMAGVSGGGPGVWLSASSALGGLFGGGGALQHGTVTSTGEVVMEEETATTAVTNSDNSSSWW